jgi:hypothetical protein
MTPDDREALKANVRAQVDAAIGKQYIVEPRALAEQVLIAYQPIGPMPLPERAAVVGELAKYAFDLLPLRERVRILVREFYAKHEASPMRLHLTSADRSELDEMPPDSIGAHIATGAGALTELWNLKIAWNADTTKVD